MNDHQPATPTDYANASGRSFGIDRATETSVDNATPGWDNYVERQRRLRAYAMEAMPERNAGLHPPEAPRTIVEHVADRSYGDGWNDGYRIGREQAQHQTADERGEAGLVTAALTVEGKPGDVIALDDLVLRRPTLTTATDSSIIHPLPTPTNSGRARVQAGATIVLLLGSVVLAFMLGYVLGALDGLRPLVPARAQVVGSRIRVQSDAPVSGELIPS